MFNKALPKEWDSSKPILGFRSRLWNRMANIAIVVVPVVALAAFVDFVRPSAA
jgi:hypothetical protein